ncbi:MAG: hypothetical protein IT317_23275 [Anaerolineales bacterium]|nr:hypothetical protein [Anaerolineales bacterium]
MQTELKPSRSPWRVAAALAVLTAAVYWLTFVGRLRSIDEQAVLAVTESLVKHGTLAANPLAFTYHLGADNLVVPGPSGDYYAHKGLLPSLLAAPLYWLGLHWPGAGLVHAALLENVLLGALTVGLLYALGARLGFCRGPSLAAALTLAFGTLLWPYAETLFTEVNTAMCWLAALYLLVSAGQSAAAWPAAGRITAAGALVGLSLGANYVNAVALPVFALYAAWPFSRAAGRPALRRLTFYALGALLGGGLFLALNLMRFGALLETGYALQADTLRLAGFGVRLYGLLLSPYRGLLWYTPLFWLAPIGFAWLGRRRPAEAALSAGLSALVVGVFSLWSVWWGGVNWGPRYLTPLMPLLALGLLPVWERALARNAAWRWLTLALAALSGWAGLVGAVTDYVKYDYAYWLDYERALSAAAPIGAVPLLYDPRLSPLLLQSADLLRGRLDLAWATPGRVDWLAVGVGLAAVALAALGLKLAWQRQWRGAPIVAALGLGLAVAVMLPRAAISAEPAGLETVAAQLAQDSRPADGIVTMLPFHAVEFANVNRLALPVYGLPSQEAPLRPEMEALLARLVSERRVVWTLAGDSPAADPLNSVEAWLVAHTFKFYHAYVGRVRVSGYYADPAAPAPRPRAEQFGPALRLTAAGLPPGPFDPGDVLPVTATWEASAPITQTLAIFVHVQDVAGVVVAQRDAAPLDGYLPAVDFVPGRPVSDRLGARLPADLPPGDYAVYLGVYDALSGVRLPITPAAPDDRLLLATITVSAP